MNIRLVFSVIVAILFGGSVYCAAFSSTDNPQDPQHSSYSQTLLPLPLDAAVAASDEDKIEAAAVALSEALTSEVTL